MNTNVISTPRRTPAELDANDTTEKVFRNSAGDPIVLPLPTSSQLCGADSSKSAAHFKVIACGRVKGNATTNFTIKLYYGTSNTVADNTLIEASTARAVNSESENWIIEVDLVWDSDSNKINGRGWSMINNLVDAVAAIDNQVTSADPDADAVRGFVVSGTFSVTDTGHTANLDSFVLVSVA